MTERDIAWEALEQRERELAAAVRADRSAGFFLLSEPRATFTGGRTAPSSELRWSEAERDRRGVATRVAERGGRWTYHGPGQLLLFPIVSLEALGYPRRAVRAFIGDLRRGVLDYVRGLGLDAVAGDEPYGVYVGGAKLASFGLAIRGGIATHGVALYLTPQREGFLGIDPCGVRGARLTSLAEEGVALPWIDAADGLAQAVKNVLKPLKIG